MTPKKRLKRDLLPYYNLSLNLDLVKGNFS